MSVPVHKRTPQKFGVLAKAIELAAHTVKICGNEKNFPKKYRWMLTEEIVRTAVRIVMDIREANSIRVVNAADLDRRRALQQSANGRCEALLTLIEIAWATFGHSGINVEHWTGLVLDVEEAISVWRRSDAAVRKRVKDDGVYAAACQIIDSFGGDKGIGLGSQVSQLVQLAVLDDLDHYVKERLREKHYLRYMDDFLIIAEDKNRLRADLDAIRGILAGLGLTLNGKTCIYPLSKGVVWLKWHYYLTPTGKVIRRMSDRSIAKMRRKLRRMKKQIDAGRMTRETAEESLRSWIANAQRGNTREAVAAMRRYYKELFDD